MGLIAIDLHNKKKEQEEQLTIVQVDYLTVLGVGEAGKVGVEGTYHHVIEIWWVSMWGLCWN